MNIEEMKQKKQELGYSYEQIASLTDLPVETVQAVFEQCSDPFGDDVLKALETVFLLDKEVTWKKVNMFHEIQPAYLVHRKQGEYTIEDYFALPDDYRVELIDGVIYDMASPTGIHQLLLGEIHRVIREFIMNKNGKCIPAISPLDVQLDCDDKTMVQPDMMIICDRNKFQNGRVYGAPDLVVEVLSPSTAKRDSYLKLSKYINAGVRECWLVDPVKKRIYVHEWKKDDVVVEMYTFNDEIPVGIFEGECKVNFKEIYEYVGFLYET